MWPALLPALVDLVHAEGMSNLNRSNPWCQEARQLERHGLARWNKSGPSSQWVATERGWKFLTQPTATPLDAA